MNDWHELSRQSAFQNEWRHIDEVRYRLPDGLEHTFYIDVGGDCAKTFAVTPDGLVVLAKEYRPGPERYILGLPGGAVEEGEEPVIAARRELREETGYDSPADMTLLTHRPFSPYSTGMKHIFFATDVVQTTEQHTDATEDIEVVLMEPAKLRELIWSGELIDVDGVMLGLHRLGVL